MLPLHPLVRTKLWRWNRKLLTHAPGVLPLHLCHWDGRGAKTRNPPPRFSFWISFMLRFQFPDRALFHARFIWNTEGRTIAPRTLAQWICDLVNWKLAISRMLFSRTWCWRKLVLLSWTPCRRIYSFTNYRSTGRRFSPTRSGQRPFSTCVVLYLVQPLGLSAAVLCRVEHCAIQFQAKVIFMLQ